jgi:2-dehydropantoate 2-reductase
MHSPSIAIMGLGAIGASIGHALYRNKVPFTVLARNEQRQRELAAGFDFELLQTATHIALSAEGPARISALGGKYDVIFLSMKASHLAESARSLLPYLAENGVYVLLQNGLPEESLPEDLRMRAVSGIVGYNVQTKDGRYWQSNHGHLILGSNARLAVMPDLKRAIEPYEAVTITDNPLGYRWNKLAINAVINGLGAVSGQPLGTIFSSRQGRTAAIGLLDEAGQVMQKLHVKEEIVPGTISVFRFGAHGLPYLLQHAILWILGRKYRHVRTSMLQDIEAGRQTEVEEIHGAIQKAAQGAGVQTPVLDAVVETIRAISSGQKKSSMDELLSLRA